MRVQLLITPKHHWSGHDWPPVGVPFECDAGLAKYMLEHGEAEAAPEPKAPEAAAVAPTERAVKPHARARKG